MSLLFYDITKLKANFFLCDLTYTPISMFMNWHCLKPFYVTLDEITYREIKIISQICLIDMLQLNRGLSSYFFSTLRPLESGWSECCLHITDITEIVRKFYKSNQNYGFSCHFAQRILILFEYILRHCSKVFNFSKQNMLSNSCRLVSSLFETGIWKPLLTSFLCIKSCKEQILI